MFRINVRPILNIGIISVITAGLFLSTGCSILDTGENVRSFGLIIGIDEYTDPRIPDLDYCVSDADGVYAALLGAGWNALDITVLKNADASKASISSAVQAIVQQAAAGDYVLVYYSGHGSSVWDVSGDELDGLDEVIVPRDANLYDSASFLSDDELHALLSDCKTEKGVFFFDSCNSGGFINSPFTSHPDTSIRSRFVRSGEGARSGTSGDLDLLNFPVISASAADEDSYEDAVLGHGVFTYYVLEGIQDLHADGNEDGYVTVRELYDYASARVQVYTLYQHPQMRYTRELVDILVTR